MDTGLSRKISNQVPVHLRSTADGGSRARLHVVSNTERVMDLLLKHAWRRLRAPQIHPGYVTTLVWYL